ncbi:carbamoyltransferase C-terminal domain-containing protein [Afipia broomeae]|nr:carbamoyltransferase C-terminal domain-containing protein [Afipia broomeae]
MNEADFAQPPAEKVGSSRYVVGINWEQNSTAALFCDGQLLGCLSEERISRVKNDERYPRHAIDYLLKEHKVSIGDIEAVAFVSDAWAPGYILTRHYTTFSIDDYISEQKRIWYPRIFENNTSVSQLDVFENKLDIDQFPGRDFWKQVIEDYHGGSGHASDVDQIAQGKAVRRKVVSRHLKLPEEKVFFFDHSFCHAAYAFYATCNDDKPRLVLTLDAFGDFVNYSARVMQRVRSGDNLPVVKERLVASGGNFIIGRLYRYVTLILGLKPNEHEYKVMGLAPYCKARYFERLLNKFRRFQKVVGCDFEDVERPRDTYFSIKELVDGERFDAISGALQAYTEELVVDWVKNCVAETGVHDVCIAGGVAMNVKANMLVSDIPTVSSLSVPPSPDDSSQAMGAGYAYYHLLNKNGGGAISISPFSTPYLGRVPVSENDGKSWAQYETLLEARGYKILRQENLAAPAAQLLASKKVIGRIVGREEFGARALGNRSILADPRDPSIKKIINEKIKDRDFWMPFACSVPAEYADRYLELGSPHENYAYMTLCCPSTREGASVSIPASVHPYDETCRPHILGNGSNSGYEALINEFGKITGTFALLNTSLNLHGLPIASSMDDALHVLFESDLDALLTEEFLAVKS